MANRDTTNAFLDYGIAAAWLGACLLAICILISFTDGRMPWARAAPEPTFEEAVHAKAQADMQDIKKQVAADAVREYRMTAASGTKMDRCTQAQLVSSAYLQAQDSVQYANWKRTELGDCKAAGLPIR